jgi:hypothetical protein
MSAARSKTLTAGVLSPNMGVYRGFTIRETLGAVATVRLWDNAIAASGTLVATIALTANASQTVALPDTGVWFANGLFAEIVAGTVEGSVYIG